MTQIILPAGANVDNEDASQVFSLGACAFGKDGSEWIYAKQIALVAGDVVAINQSDFTVAKLTNTLAAKGDKIAIAQATKTVDYFGWFLVKGGSGTSYKVRARNACAINVALYTSAVAGMLDDTNTTALTRVYGVTLRDTATSSGAAEEAYIPIEPHV